MARSRGGTAALQQSLLSVTQAVHQLKNAATADSASTGVLLTQRDINALVASISELSSNVTSALARPSRRRRETGFTSPAAALSRTTSAHSLGSEDSLWETFAAQPHIFDPETQATIMGMVSHTPVTNRGSDADVQLGSPRRVSVVTVGGAAGPKSFASSVKAAYAQHGDADKAVQEALQPSTPEAAFLDALDSWDFDIFKGAGALSAAYDEQALTTAADSIPPPGPVADISCMRQDSNPDRILSEHRARFQDSAVFGCRPLVAVGTAALQQLGVLAALDIDPGRLLALLDGVAAGYDALNPYHNALHGADVAHGVFFMLCETGGGLAKAARLRYETQLAAILAAAAHDMGHPGVNNPFLIATSHKLAIQYNDASPLENMHAAALFSLMQDSGKNPLRRLAQGTVPGIRRAIIHMILSTDNALHFTHVAALQQRLESLPSSPSTCHVAADTGSQEGHGSGTPIAWSVLPPAGDDGGAGPGQPQARSDSTSSTASLPDPATFSPTEDELLVLSMLVHACDISNPARPWHLYTEWTDRIVEEFQRQGDREKAMGLPVGPLNDRDSKVPRCKAQAGFIRALVLPLFTALTTLPGLDILESCHAQLSSNLHVWEEQIAALSEVSTVDGSAGQGAAAAPSD